MMLELDKPNTEYAKVAYTSSSIENHCKNVIDSLFTSVLQTRQTNHVRVIYIKDPITTRKKLDKLIQGGTSHLQVVSDFDRTMSKFQHNGLKTPTCHGIFEMDPELTDQTKDELKSLTKKYRAIEIDPGLTNDEKSPHMVQWWEKSHEVIVDCKIHRSALVKTVNGCGLYLRDKVCDFAKLLEKHKIPLIVFSAGLGDVIQLLLERFNIYTENVRVVSNFMIFDEKDVISGFTEPIIHSFNKTAANISTGEYAEISSRRPCVLLLGDSTGDVHMADGATVEDPSGDSGTVLRIGFLNEGIEDNLDTYQRIYDIVLVNDESFDVPLRIMQSIIQCHEAVTEATNHTTKTS